MEMRTLSGFIAPLVALIGISLAVLINRSWWSLTENAFSDLGKVGLSNNWVFNGTIILTALLALYSYTRIVGKLEGVTKAGTAIYTFGIFFLLLIGLFPEGTWPHYYVSWAFFIIAGLGVAVTGFGLLLEGEKTPGISGLLIFLVAFPLSFWALKHFRGVAVAELIGALAIALWNYVFLYTLLRRKVLV